MTPHQKKRYLRHTLLPQVGEAGQEKLLAASVLIVGVGGLGSPAALYLAAAGIGRIGLIDADVVDESNLQRQILFETAQIGRPKTESAESRLRAMNPELVIEQYQERLTIDNAREIVGKYDLIVDGSDNFPTRYLTNDVAFLLKKPLVYGSIFQFEGQVTVFHPTQEGPCYRCLVPDPPAANAVPNCAEAGVLGALPGVIGSLQAMEALKILLGIGEQPFGRLLCYQALTSDFRTLKLRKDPDCVLCSAKPTLENLRHEGHSCPVNADYQEITTDEFRKMQAEGWDGFLLDVRTPDEYAESDIEGSTLIPLQELPLRFEEVPRDVPIVIHCKAGMRSANACTFLSQKGYTQLSNLSGGIDAW